MNFAHLNKINKVILSIINMTKVNYFFFVK